MTIEKELLSATKLKAAKKGEDRQEYLKRLSTAGAEVSNDEWEKLSENAQTWVNKAVKIGNDGGEINEFGDVEVAASPKKSGKKAAKGGKTASKAGKKAEPAPAKKAAKGNKAAGNKAAEKAPVKSRRASGKPTGALALIKSFLIKDPNISLDELEKKFRDKGGESSRVVIGSCRNDFRHSLRCLQDAGFATEIQL